MGLSRAILVRKHISISSNDKQAYICNSLCLGAIISTNTSDMSDISFSQLTCKIAGTIIVNDTTDFVRADIANFEEKHILSSRMHGGGATRAN